MKKLEQPTIAYVNMGGTVGAEQRKDVYGETPLTADEIVEVLDGIEGIRGRINLLGIDVADINSKEVMPELWTTMVEAIQSVYGRVDGVVVGHGLYTMAHTAAALSCAMKKLSVPVVVTGSQRPLLGANNTDAIPNLRGAVQVAARGNIAEVLAFANGKIYRPEDLGGISEDDDFLNSGVNQPIGHLYDEWGHVVLKSDLTNIIRRDEYQKGERVLQPNFGGEVHINKIHPGLSPEFMKKLLNGGGRMGFLLETYGKGGLPERFEGPILDVLEAGHPVYLLSNGLRVRSIGPKVRNRDLGGMPVHEASVGLMHALGNNPDATVAEIDARMLESKR